MDHSNIFLALEDLKPEVMRFITPWLIVIRLLFSHGWSHLFIKIITVESTLIPYHETRAMTGHFMERAILPSQSLTISSTQNNYYRLNGCERWLR